MNDEITFRIDPNLKKDFETICKALEVQPGQQLQALIIQFIAKHGEKLTQ